MAFPELRPSGLWSKSLLRKQLFPRYYSLLQWSCFVHRAFQQTRSEGPKPPPTVTVVKTKSGASRSWISNSGFGKNICLMNCLKTQETPTVALNMESSWSEITNPKARLRSFLTPSPRLPAPRQRVIQNYKKFLPTSTPSQTLYKEIGNDYVIQTNYMRFRSITAHSFLVIVESIPAIREWKRKSTAAQFVGQ